MRKFYSLLGLCKRAGRLAGGEVAAEQAVRGKEARMLVVAGDASANTKKKFRNSAAYYHIPLVETGTKAELGKAVGEEMRAVFAVLDAGFAKKLQEIADECDGAEEHTEI